LVCGKMPHTSRKYVYTVPWSFEKVNTSMLANDDTNSICPNVRILTVDMCCSILPHRFQNIHTLIILPQYDLTRHDCDGFRRLRHLTTANIETVSSFTRLIDTLTLTELDEFWKQQIVYSNVHHLILQDTLISSVSTVTSLVKQFPNLHSLEILFKRNAEYFDSLNVLLDRRHLPDLKMLKTNWTEDKSNYDDKRIKMWINQKTILKWQSTPVYAHCDGEFLTICP
jgi:hypothetical protein